MKAFSIVKLVFLIITIVIGVFLLVSCKGIVITPGDDGSVTVTPDNGNNALGGDKTPNKENTHSHTYVLDNVDSTYTCTDAGNRVWKCECGESFSEAIEAPGHDMRSYQGKDATCDIDGYEDYEKCVRGNCGYSTYKVIPALGHDLLSLPDIAPTCTEDGITDRVECTRNDCTYYAESEVSKLGHLHQVIGGKSATCEEEGYYPYEICQRDGCDGEGLTAKVYIDALGHDVIHYDGKEPTCVEFGWNEYTVCQRCEASTYAKIEPSGHSFVNGFCYCGQFDMGLHSHVWNDGEIVLDSTCTSPGSVKYTCTDVNCGDSKTEIINALGHDNVYYSEKAPTCNELGWYAYNECLLCGYSNKVNIPMLSHSYVGVVTIQPSCNTSGMRTFTCSCGKSYNEEISKLGHDWGNWYIEKDATCVSNGQEKRVCYNNTDHVDIRTISKTGHKYEDWYITSNPTCAVKGQERRVCENDSSHAEIREIPTVDHTVNSDTGVCTVCNQQIKERLATPSNILEMGSVIYWDVVDGAEYYEIIVDGDVNEVYSTQFDLQNYYASNYILQIRMRSVASVNSGIVPSEYLNYTFDIPNEPIAEYSGLGKTVNLLTGGYTEIDTRRTSIFDDAKFNRLRVEEVEDRKSYSDVRYSETLHGYVDKLTESNRVKVDMSISADFMQIINATSGYSFEINENYEEMTQSETKSAFYDMDYYYTHMRAGIYGSNDLSILSSALSEDFLLNALQVQNGELSPETFIQWYGTHIITSGVYGGSFNLHYEMISSTDKVENTYKVGSQLQISSQIGAAIKGLNINQNVNTDIETNFEAFRMNNASDVQSKFVLVTHGGNITGKVCESLSDFSEVCSDWAADLKAGNDYVLIDVDDGSLVFVWELLGDEYAGAKNLLYNYFYSSCNEQYYDLKDKISSLYKDSYIFDETEGTLVIDFSNLQPLKDTASLDNIIYSMEGGTVVFDGKVFNVFSAYNFKEVKKVIFKGNYMIHNESNTPYEGKFAPFTIKFDSNWTQDIVIEFENFAYVAPDGYVGLDFSEVSSENITIILKGSNYIKGGDGESLGKNGYAGISAPNSNIKFQGNGKIDVIGGNGKTGKVGSPDNVEDTAGGAGGKGGVGAVGIEVKVLTVFGTSLTAKGGDGGTGGRGGHGNNWNYGPPNIPRDGGKGGKGGSGAVSISANIIYLENASLIAKGGNGGDGGRGGNCGKKGTNGDVGKGGSGGEGSMAISCEIVYKNSYYEITEGTDGKTGAKGT